MRAHTHEDVGPSETEGNRCGVRTVVSRPALCDYFPPLLTQWDGVVILPHSICLSAFKKHI